MTTEMIVREIKRKQSFLCIGLDVDLSKIPTHLLELSSPIFEFNKAIIDATHEFCVAYKPNIAFYEAMGINGWKSLEKTIRYIPKNIFTIADAKRGDIGNTSKKYAETFFSTYSFDAITVAPYMGMDSVMPFLEYSNKWTIILGLTSNKGSSSFQNLKLENGIQLHREVITNSMNWGSNDNTMYVVGATQSKDLIDIRKLIPNHFLLIPGIGAQGGNMEEVIKNGLNNDIGLLVNSSRGIIYAGEDAQFDSKARDAASKIQIKMADYL
jgi:orotidine-5'-phosphate decarboxylase